MNQLNQLKAACETLWAKANADFMNNELFHAAEKASAELSAFESKLYGKRAEFEALSQHEKVDPCICRENAGDGTGYDEEDFEFWDICVREAQNFIDGIYD